MSATARVLVGLIVAGTVALVVGVAVERHQTVETPTQRAVEGGSAGRVGESTAEGEEAERRSERVGHVESSERLLGVDPESTGVLGVAVVVSLLLAAAVWWRGGSPLVLGGIAAAMAAFCALDIREVVHQVNESRTGLAVLAGGVAALHAAAALLAARAAVTTRGVPPPAVSAAVRDATVRK
ncbi:MAG TPA: hypothetical protein VKB54_04315 [Solirubrobacteraceae bacterium]|nr:hypothetical protein [Solirubrobacteraceae bacterium]